MLLCYQHKLQPKLAGNHGFGASCPYSVLSALPSTLDHWLSLKHLYPLMMSDSWSPTQPARERWADPWQSSFPPCCVPADVLAECASPSLGSVSAALSNEKTESNIVCGSSDREQN